MSVNLWDIARKISKQRDTARPTWITSQVSLIAATIFLIHGCAWDHPKQELPTGIITGVLKSELSLAPGEEPFAKANGNVALLVETRLQEGANWGRFIFSDGHTGWTAIPLSNVKPVTADATIEPFALMQDSPDNTEIESSAERLVGQATEGRVLGASNQSRVAWPNQLMVPERLQVSRVPWLHLSFGNIKGHASLGWLRLTWGRSVTNSEGLADTLESTAAIGLLRKPFLGPFWEGLLQLGPPLGAPLLILEDTDQALSESSNELVWSEVESLYVDPSDTSRMLVVYGHGQNRLFQFGYDRTPTLRLVQREDQVYVRRIELHDLNGDGAVEWLLEVVGVYGDGWYSMLWHVDESAFGERPAVNRILLSHSSGESETTDTDAAWWVDEKNSIWVSRATDNTSFKKYRYSDQGLHIVRLPKGINIAVVAEHKNYIEAQAAAIQSERTVARTGVFPFTRESDGSWITGVPFDQQSDAYAFIRQHPGSRIISLPPVSPELEP